MNDKQQLAAMGEHMADQAEQPMCMAKRIEELEAQLHVHASISLIKELRDGVEGEWCFPGDLYERIDALLTGQVPAPAVPEGWQLVPVEPTEVMLDATNEHIWGRDTDQNDMLFAYRAMLAAAPKPETKP